MARDLIKGVASIFSMKVSELALGMIITPILVRILDPSGYGDYAFLISLIGFIMNFANAGIFDSVRKYIAEDRHMDSWKESVFAFHFRIASLFSIAVAATIAGSTYLGITRSIFGPGLQMEFYVISIFIIVEQLLLTTRGTLMGLKLESYSEPLLTLRTAGFGLVGIPLAYFGFGVLGVLVGKLVATILVVLGGSWILSRQFKFTSVFRSTPPTLPKRSFLQFNLMTVVLSMLVMSLYHVDVLMIRTFLGSSPTGFYKVALVIAEFLWFIPVAIELVLLQSVSPLWRENKIDEITAIASKATRYALWIGLLMGVGITFLAEPFIRLYFGPEYRVAVLPLLVLLPGSLCFTVSRPIIAIGQANGNIRPLVIATGSAAVINVVLNAILIPSHGIFGAAVATSIGYGSMILAQVFAAWRLGFDPTADVRLLRMGVSGGIVGVILFFFVQMIGSELLTLAIVPPIGFVAFSVVTILFGAISIEEVKSLTDRIPLSDRIL